MATITPEIAERPAASQPAPEKLSAAKRQYPGALVVVEGIDGSGKSTQLYLLKRWLEIGGYRIHFTEWNSSPLVKSATRRGKQRRLLTPTTFSMLHAADFADRCERQILPLAARRLPGARRSVHLHGLCARRGARLLAALAAQPVQLRSHSGHHVLFSSAARRGGEPDRGGPAQAEILRSRDGPWTFAGPRGKFPDFPGKDSE